MSTAVIVKFTRTLMIVLSLFAWPIDGPGGMGAQLTPITDTRLGHRSVPAHIRAGVPGFVIWFLLAVTINSLGDTPGWWHRWFVDLD